MAEQKRKKNSSIKIADDVIATIAGTAVLEVDEVSCLEGSSIAGSITEILGYKNLAKGIKLTFDEADDLVVDTHIIAKYGYNLKETGEKVQEKVKGAVETMTGLTVSGVNVHITGILADKTKKMEPVNFD